MLLACSNVIGMIATVPFKVPVALFGYNEAIGFGESCVWHVPGTTLETISGKVAADAEKYEVLAYRSASIDKKLSRKYCSREF
jgi:hypothetical protein